MRNYLLLSLGLSGLWGQAAVTDSSPFLAKARHFQQDLLDKHWLDGLYISIVPVLPPGVKHRHDVEEPGNVIHAGVWTGRYLAGVGYQYAVTRDPWARRHGGEILQALRLLREVTGKPGLLARGYVRGHGPVEDWERDGQDSREWRQGQGKYAGYRWYGDVSVDNLNSVLYGYAIYYDLAADAAQKELITAEVDSLMTHVLDNQCRIIDVDGEVTMWGHIGVDPDPSRTEYYRQLYRTRFAHHNISTDGELRLPLRSSILLLPDLLIAHRITGKDRYRQFYERVIARFKDNPDRPRHPGPFSVEKLPLIDHSSEGQFYEALYHLFRYEKRPEYLARYRPWLDELWDHNWMEGNTLYAYMTLALWPEHAAPPRPGVPAPRSQRPPHAEEGLRLANETLRLFPVDRVFRPVMNSIRTDLEVHPRRHRSGYQIATRPLPVNQRPADNEYAWKGNPYQLDSWLKPAVVAWQAACDDPLVAWFADATGRVYLTLDAWKTWRDVSPGLQGARVRNLKASPVRTFVLHALTDQGVYLTRDGGLSWRPSPETPEFPEPLPKAVALAGETLQINAGGDLLRGGTPAMEGWRIPRAQAVFRTPRGVLASSPGGAYLSEDGRRWTELKLWREQETGAADFVHAYWMGRYYGFLPAE